MWDILNNPWVSGIGGGVVSGLVVFFITKWLFSDQSKREIAQKANAANNEIVYSVRSGIPEGTVPTASVLTSMIKSTARKYSIDHHKINGIEDICDDLIKEVMDSSFISAKTKEQYCLQLRGLAVSIDKMPPDEGPNVERHLASNERSRLVMMMSVTLATVATVMTVILTILEGRLVSDTPEFERVAIQIPLLVAGIITGVATVMVFTARLRRKKYDRPQAFPDMSQALPEPKWIPTTKDGKPVPSQTSEK